jgi:hypothetical protein
MGMKQRHFEKERGKVTRKRRALLLLATEGSNKTETLYFSHFKAAQENYTVHFVPGNFTDPKSMVESVRRYAEKVDYDEQAGDAAFCIVDLDADEARAATIKSIMQNPPVKGLDCIVSNPCFEVWYLCHFGYSTKSFMNSDAVVKQLRKTIPSYSKGKTLYPQIELKTTDAINNARKLDEHHTGLGRPRYDVAANPTTEAYRVVELLRQDV